MAAYAAVVQQSGRACSVPPAQPLPLPNLLPLLSLPFPAGQFFLTLGTIVLGAYVAVRVFGVDVAGVTGIGGGGIGGSRGAARSE